MQAAAPLAVQPARNYAGAFPKFSQPKELGCFSRDAARRVSHDRSSLRPYRVPRLPAVLDEGFETYVKRAGSDGGEVAALEPVLAALSRNSVTPAANSIVTYRNNLNKIFLTPYQPRDDWEVGVERRADGVVLLHVRDTARKQAEESQRDERGERMCYWGYRFEQLATLTEAESAAYETKTMHRLVRAPKNNGQGYWEPTVCINFGKAVLEWCMQHVQAAPAGARFVMRYDPSRGAVSLLPDADAGAGDADAAAGADDGPPSAKRARV